jgi:hypothetical protein
LAPSGPSANDSGPSANDSGPSADDWGPSADAVSVSPILLSRQKRLHAFVADDAEVLSVGIAVHGLEPIEVWAIFERSASPAAGESLLLAALLDYAAGGTAAAFARPSAVELRHRGEHILALADLRQSLAKIRKDYREPHAQLLKLGCASNAKQILGSRSDFLAADDAVAAEQAAVGNVRSIGHRTSPQSRVPRFAHGSPSGRSAKAAKISNPLDTAARHVHTMLTAINIAGIDPLPDRPKVVMASCWTIGITSVINRLSPHERITSSETFGLLRQRPKANSMPTIQTAIIGNETAHCLMAPLSTLPMADSEMSIG